MNNLKKLLYKKRQHCRICDGQLQIVLDLGDIAINDFVLDKSQIDYSPLTLCKCVKCDLVQLEHTTDQDFMYKQYWYLSGINKGMVASLQNIVDNIESRINLKNGDTVIDIGCNDGTMLGQYTNKNLNRIGFDPAKNLADKAKNNCELFYNTYFGNTEIKTPLAKVITSIAMFYDLEDPHAFIELIKKSLHPEGIWVIQFTDLMSMFKINAYDNITHEHLEYYSFEVLKKLIEGHGLEITEVQTNEANGHSVRLFIRWKGIGTVTDSVNQHLIYEREYMGQYTDPFLAFGGRCTILKSKTIAFIKDALLKGKTIAAMGASSKGNTLLQYLELNNNDILYAAEVSSDKFGRYTVATNIPIISEEEAINRNPDYFLVLPWHFKKGLVEKHSKYLDNGGHFIFPCPELEII